MNYYFIPLKLEKSFSDKITQWTSKPNNGWTCISGVYINSQTFTNGNSLVKNIIKKDRKIIDIPYSITDLSNNIQTLIGFTLEGDLGKYVPEFETQLIALGIPIFDNANDYNKFIKYHVVLNYGDL